MDSIYSVVSTGSWIGVIIVVVIVVFSAIRVLREYERGVVFRLGRLIAAKGPGLIFLIPIVDKMVKVSLRIVTMDVPVQEVITKDNVPIKVNAVVYFRVIDPIKSVIEVGKFLNATPPTSPTPLLSVVGQIELDELLSQREKVNQTLQRIIDEHTGPWGIKVSAVEVKDLELPEGMKRAMAKQAEAERERRAKIINAEGEFQAAQKLAEASKIMSSQPMALQLRFLQTMREISSEHNTTTILPFPIELIKPLLGKNFYEKEGE